MCKKAVEGLDALCLEVTFGKAALVKTRQEGERLARLMVRQQSQSLGYHVHFDQKIYQLVNKIYQFIRNFFTEVEKTATIVEFH